MDTNKDRTRPQLLTRLCISSFTVGSLWIIMFLTIVGYSLSGNVPSALFPGIVIEYYHSGYVFVITEIVLTILGIIGVSLMWKLQKKGFYLYAGAKTLIYFLPVLFIGSNHLHFPGLVLTSCLIVIYGVIVTNTHSIRKSK